MFRCARHYNIAAFQNALGCNIIDLDAQAFRQAVLKLAGDLSVVMFSPDGGGVKRAELMRESYEAEIGREVGFMEKRRSHGIVSGTFVGDPWGEPTDRVADRSCVAAHGGAGYYVGRHSGDRPLPSRRQTKKAAR